LLTWLNCAVRVSELHKRDECVVGSVPLKILFRRKANLRLWVIPPMCLRLPDLTRQDHRRLPREESPGRAPQHEFDRAF
jgi:hypothetical protein